MAASVGRPKHSPPWREAAAKAAARAEAKVEVLASYVERKDIERSTVPKAVAAARAVVSSEGNRRHLEVVKVGAGEKGPNWTRLPAPNSPKCIVNFSTSLVIVSLATNVI